MGNNLRAVKKSYNDSYGYKDFCLSSSQRTCQNIIRESSLTFVEGYAGVGKSLAALHLFVQDYLRDATKKLIIVRTPMESAGKDKLGYLPADLDQKIEPHFASSRLLLEQLLNKGKVECDLGKRIEFKVPNYMLGATLDSSLTVIEEAQCLEPMIMKLLLERIGTNSKCVVLGDRTQVYSKDKNRNGMTDALSRFLDKDGKPLYDDVGYYKFGIEDVQRSDIVKTVIKAYST